MHSKSVLKDCSAEATRIKGSWIGDQAGAPALVHVSTVEFQPEPAELSAGWHSLKDDRMNYSEGPENVWGREEVGVALRNWELWTQSAWL